MGTSKSFNLLQPPVSTSTDASSVEVQLNNTTEKTILSDIDSIPVIDTETAALKKISFRSLKTNLSPDYIKKPVLSMVNELPSANRTVGDRYFLIAGISFLSIAEWNGTDWSLHPTRDGDMVYSFSQRKFIIRTPENYQTSSVSDDYEVDFNLVESVIVRHNLNRYPSVVVLDSTNRQITTQITYIGRNSCEVSWTGETSGKIVCN